MRVSGQRIHAGAAILVAVLTVVTGCGRRTAARVPAPPSAPARIGATETGVASWYGAPYDGRLAASGEIYDMEQLTAAHRSLPFGTWVKVADLDNGRSVNVRITDRGPFVDGRVIDLSHAAARRIDMLGTGTARVRLEVIAPPKDAREGPPARGQYAVQAGVFSDRQRAETLRASLQDRFEDVRLVQNSSLWHVLIGHHMTFDAATQLATSVRRSVGEAVLVPDR